MNIKAATDLPGQDQQSDEEDEEIHRAHRLQVLQHSGSACRGRRGGGGERGQRDADAARRQSHFGVTLKIMTAAVFQSTVNGQTFPSSLRALKAEVHFFFLSRCREMHPARKQTSAVKQSQAISSPFDSVELLSHPGTENKSSKTVFFSPGAADFFSTSAVSQNSAPLTNVLTLPPSPLQLLSHRLRPPQSATA